MHWDYNSDDYAPISLIQKVENTTRVKVGAKVRDYGFKGLNVSMNHSETLALFEFDLGYISIPRVQFKALHDKVLMKIFAEEEIDCFNEERCSIKMKCDDAKKKFTQYLESEKGLMSRLHLSLSNLLEYQVPLDTVLQDRKRILPKPSLDVCDLLI